MVKSDFVHSDQEINSCWSDLCPPGFALAQNSAVLNTFVRTIHHKQGKKKKVGIFLSTCVYLNGTKQFCLQKVKRKAIPFIILLMRVTNELTARWPLVIGGKFLFLVLGLLVKASSYLKRRWWKSSGRWRGHACCRCYAVCRWRDPLLHVQVWWSHRPRDTAEFGVSVAWLTGCNASLKICHTNQTTQPNDMFS